VRDKGQCVRRVMEQPVLRLMACGLRALQRAGQRVSSTMLRMGHAWSMSGSRVGLGTVASASASIAATVLPSRKSRWRRTQQHCNEYYLQCITDRMATSSGTWTD